jgi:hypothetical protein
LSTPYGILRALQVDGILLDALLDGSRSEVSEDSYPSYGYYYMSSTGSGTVCFNRVQNNDGIWVLKGCSSALILRAHERYGYTLVSNATMRPVGVEKVLKWAKERWGGWQNINIV